MSAAVGSAVGATVGLAVGSCVGSTVGSPAASVNQNIIVLEIFYGISSRCKQTCHNI